MHPVSSASSRQCVEVKHTQLRLLLVKRSGLRLAALRGSAQDGHHLMIRPVPQNCAFVLNSALFPADGQRQTNSICSLLAGPSTSHAFILFCFCFLRWNGRSAVHDAPVPAGSCWKHERHDEFQQHVTANQQVALKCKSSVRRPRQPPPSCTHPVNKDFDEVKE